MLDLRHQTRSVFYIVVKEVLEVTDRRAPTLLLVLSTVVGTPGRKVRTYHPTPWQELVFPNDVLITEVDTSARLDGCHVPSSTDQTGPDVDTSVESWDVLS